MGGNFRNNGVEVWVRTFALLGSESKALGKFEKRDHAVF